MVNPNRFDELSPKEAAVCRLIANGASTKDVAQHFDLSIKTVDAHKTAIFRKLGVHSTVMLIHACIAGGFIHPHVPDWMANHVGKQPAD